MRKNQRATRHVLAWISPIVLSALIVANLTHLAMADEPAGPKPAAADEPEISLDDSLTIENEPEAVVNPGACTVTEASPSGETPDDAQNQPGLTPLVPGDDLIGRLTPKAKNPLDVVSGEMGVVRDDLGHLATGQPTQERQADIVRKLDDLIAQLEQECEACRQAGRSSRNPTKPLDDSRLVAGPGGSGDLHSPRNDEKKWGQLPPRERERILQSLTQGFPSHYQRILERYYRHLAEENLEAMDGGAAAGDADSSAQEPSPDSPISNSADEPKSP